MTQEADAGATWFIVVDPSTNEGHFCYAAALGRSFGHEHIKDAMQEPELRDSAKRWVVRPAFAARSAPVWCRCGDAIVAADPGLCGTCAALLRAQLETMSDELSRVRAELEAIRRQL